MPKITTGRAKLKVRPSDEKLGELILLISERSQDDPTFGAVKLNKLLFYCDFRAYLTFGNPITGQEYFALKNGPAPRRLLPVTSKMSQKRDFAVQQVEYCGYIQKKPIALRPADVSVFTAQEINLIDQTIQECRGKNATEISERSHLFVGWKIARDKEIIPYQTSLVGFRKPTEAEREYGLSLEALAQECTNAARSA